MKKTGWIIKNKKGNNFGDLLVTYKNLKTGVEQDFRFFEGEHHEAEEILNELNNEKEKEMKKQLMLYLNQDTLNELTRRGKGKPQRLIYTIIENYLAGPKNMIDKEKAIEALKRL